MEKVIRSNHKGQLLFSSMKKEYYIEFGNVYITLDQKQYKEFKHIVGNINTESNRTEINERFRIPFKSDNISLVFTRDEVIILKDLFGLRPKTEDQFRLKVNFSMN